MDWWWRKKNKKLILERGAMVLKDLIEFGHGQSNPIKFFSADEIRKATNYFSDSNLERDYPFNWYSGKNENHPMIFRWSGFRVDLIARDIAVSSMVSGHKNFLKLVGCCLEFEYPVMVYHGVKKHYRLDISEETWKRRMKIAQDIATALAYLHTAFPRPFVYRSLSLRKILLDEDGVAKLNDFSYCVSIPEGETFVKVDEKAHGFYSYLDDNYKSGGVVSEKTDVFALGKFMGLTLLLGKEIFWELDGSLRSKLKEDRGMEEIADPKMIEKMGQISEQELCQMEAFRMLSLRCIGPSEEVPTMVEVAKELKKIQRSLQNDSSSPSGETHFDSNQDISPSGEMGWLRKKKPKSDVVSDIVSVRGAMVLKDLIECCDGKSNPIKFFSADEILKATNNFSDSNLVSGLVYYYKWYSGKNENHPMILIKECVGFSSLRVDHLCRDIAVSSMVSGHKNFLKLVGCCLELERPVMVYHGVKKHNPLEISEQPWKRRMKIAEDIATALAYLHTAFPRPFVYRSLSLQNILLDEDGVAKLIGFSLCVSIPEGETFVKVDRAEIFYNYLYDYDNSSGVVSEKTDVFAFGMFMGLRLLLGNRRIGEKEESEGGGSDTGYASYASMTKRRNQNVMSKLKEDRRMEEIADPEMIDKMGQISEQELCQMEAFRMLSLRCMGPSEEVPTMVEVAKELKKIQTSLNM